MAMLVICLPIKSHASLTEVQRLLGGHSMVCANFTQEKLLKALNRPLISTGRLVFVTGKGVLWQVREPFPARLLIKSNFLTRWNDQGDAQNISLDQTPVFQALSHVFLALFSGKTEKLRDIFDVEIQSGQSAWRLTLVPKTKVIAAIMGRIHASGSRFVEDIFIEENRGDRTSIRFEDIESDTCTLGNAEKGYFAQ